MVLATLAERAAGVLSDIGDHARAVRLLAAGLPLAPRATPVRCPTAGSVDRAEAAALSHLGRRAYDTERRTGATLTPDDVLGNSPRPTARHGPTRPDRYDPARR